MSTIKAPTLIKSFEVSLDLSLNRLDSTPNTFNEDQDRPLDEDKDAEVPQNAPHLSKFRLGCIIFGLCLSLFLVVLDFV